MIFQVRKSPDKIDKEIRILLRLLIKIIINTNICLGMIDLKGS